MMLTEFGKELLESLGRHFPSARVERREMRGIVYEARAYITDNTFIEIYFNAMTKKNSFALISDGKRSTGYDNYRFWHFHPAGEPERHVKCDEPSLDSVIAGFKHAMERDCR